MLTCSQCAYVSAVLRKMCKYHEALTTYSYLCIREKTNVISVAGELNKSWRQRSTEAETRDLISGHTREISMSFPGREQRMGSKHGFRMNRFFIRKIFILHYGR